MTRTGFVVEVREQGIYAEPAWMRRRTRVGTRFDVVVNDGTGPVPLYVTVRDARPDTRAALLASFCLESKKKGLAVTVGSRDTRWGEEIITVGWIETPAEEQSA